MKNQVILIDVVLSGLSQGLDEETQIHALPSVLLKGFANEDERIQQNYNIKVLRFKEYEKPRSYLKKVLIDKPKVIGFSAYTWNYIHIREATKLIKKNNPEIIIIWGGPQVSYNPIEHLNKVSELDIVVCGAGETAFKRVLLSLITEDKISNIPALAFRDKGRVPIQNKGMYTEDLSLIPSPFQNGLINLAAPGKHAVYLETFRGCPKKCGYCVWGAGLKKPLYYPLESVLKDIEIIYGSPNVVNVYVTDAFLFYHPKRGYKILQKIIDCNIYKTPTFLEFDPFHLQPEHIPYVKPVCQSDYRIGVQSFTEDALTLASRSKTGRDLVKSKIDMIRREDTNAKISFALIYGLPGDSFEGFRETLSFALALQPDSLKINVLSVLPGSGYWKSRELLGLFFEEEPPHRVMRSNDFSKEDIRKCEILSAWLTYFLRFKLFKDIVGSLVKTGLLDEPIVLIDALINRLSSKEKWIIGKSIRTNISVEEENQRRMFIIDKGTNSECKMRFYKSFLDVLNEWNIKGFDEEILNDLKHFKLYGNFINYYPQETWKR